MANRKVGFSLIELLLYIGLVALFLTAATTSLWDIILGNVKSGVHQEVQENLRYAAHRIQFEIRNADSVNPGSGFDINLATNPSEKISLSVPDPDNPTEFRVSGGVLHIKRGDGSWAALTSSALEVTDLTFTDLGDTASEYLEFTVTVKYKNPSGRSQWEKEATFRGAAQLR
jgi:type II secretory pathway pseudopilin PulG